MSNRAADIQRILSDQDPQFRQWADEHRQCETALLGVGDVHDRLHSKVQIGRNEPLVGRKQTKLSVRGIFADSRSRLIGGMTVKCTAFRPQ